MTNNETTRARASFLVRRRTQIGLVLFLLLLPCLALVSFAWEQDVVISFILRTLGYALVVLGVLGRLWCLVYIGARKDRELQMTGPYSLVRHPLYVGSLLLGVGFSLYTENPLVLGIVLIYFAVQYRVTISHEEAVLANLFGEQHADYVRRVPCFIPRLSGFNPEPPGAITNLQPLRQEAVHALVFLGLLPLLDLLRLLHIQGLLALVRW